MSRARVQAAALVWILLLLATALLFGTGAPKAEAAAGGCGAHMMSCINWCWEEFDTCELYSGLPIAQCYAQAEACEQACISGCGGG